VGRLLDGVMNIFQIRGALRPSGTRRLDTSFTCGSTGVLQSQITAMGFPPPVAELTLRAISCAQLCNSFEMLAGVRGM